MIARTLRSSLIGELRADHVAFGRAMGLPERTILSRLALRNAVIPTLTVVGMTLGSFIGGAVLIENVFNVPGLGQLIVTSFMAQDYPVAIASTYWTAGTLPDRHPDRGPALLRDQPAHPCRSSRPPREDPDEQRHRHRRRHPQAYAGGYRD